LTTIDLACRQSFSFPLHSVLTCKSPDILSVGRGYQSFLTMEIPPCIGLNILKQARLILYKVPNGDAARHPECPQDRYHVYPLLDFYSIYGRLYSPPRIDEALRVEFSSDPNQCVTEIDVTSIVNAWLGGALENKGLILTGNEDTHRLEYASSQYQPAGMSPMLRLVCEDVTICQPLSVLCCTVTLSH
jgi:hypothetical protein